MEDYEDCFKAYIIVVYIIFFFSGLLVFIISFIQLSNNYDFKNITKTVENLEEKNKYCDDFISYIKYKFDEKIPKIKIIINLFFKLLQFIYSFLRLKNIKKGCRIGILFSIILFLGNICEVILTPKSYGYYPNFSYFLLMIWKNV